MNNIRYIIADLKTPIHGLNYDVRVFVECVKRSPRVKIAARNRNGRWIIRWVSITHLRNFRIMEVDKKSAKYKLSRWKTIELWRDNETTYDVLNYFKSMEDNPC